MDYLLHNHTIISNQNHYNMYLAFDLIPLSAFFPTLFNVVDLIVIFPNLEQPLNVSLPIFFTPAPMVTLVSFLQPLKAVFPIETTLLPMVTLMIFLLSLNAFAAIDVTL